MGDLTIKAYGVVVDLVMDGEPFGTVVGRTKEEARSRAEEIKRRWEEIEHCLTALGNMVALAKHNPLTDWDEDARARAQAWIREAEFILNRRGQS